MSLLCPRSVAAAHRRAAPVLPVGAPVPYTSTPRPACPCCLLSLGAAVEVGALRVATRQLPAGTPRRVSACGQAGARRRPLPAQVALTLFHARDTALRALAVARGQTPAQAALARMLVRALSRMAAWAGPPAVTRAETQRREALAAAAFTAAAPQAVTPRRLVVGGAEAGAASSERPPRTYPLPSPLSQARQGTAARAA